MKSRLIKTKFRIPLTLKSDISRPRLLDMLESGLGIRHKLILGSTPVGYVKTTLISKWIDTLKKDKKTAWLYPCAFLTGVYLHLQK